MEGGKLESRLPLASAAAGQNPSPISVCDKLSGSLFLIDSGAEVSLLPPTAADRTQGDRGKPLTAVNSSEILWTTNSDSAVTWLLLQLGVYHSGH